MSRALAIAVALLASAAAARAEESAFEAHWQSTYAWQLKPGFNSPYEGQNSLGGARARGYSFTATMFIGARLPQGTELYFNPEIVQSVAFSGLHGQGGFANGEYQRGSGAEPKAYRARFFLRHAWNLGGEEETQASEANQLRARYAAERVVLTFGNVSVLDVFDAMDYSRDARTQFMNWSSLTYGAWDYPADARGYTWGAALEYITPDWQVRAGRFLVPVESNGLKLDRSVTQRYGDVAEFELPYRLGGLPAIARALVFRNRVHAGRFSDALEQGAATASTPDLTLVRRDQAKSGFGLGTQVDVRPWLGAYVRAGWSDGKTEAFMFTEIDRSLAGGVLAKGEPWGRPQDSAGLALYLNGLSQSHRSYLAAGGMGFFLGDGRLNYGTERIIETFYSLGLLKGVSTSIGAQHVINPGYNRDRGPANFFGVRLHAEI